MEISLDEIIAGRGEFTSNKSKWANFTIDNATVEILKPWIKFNDEFTKLQVRKHNLLRSKLNIPLLADASELLNDQEKASLILHGILSHTKGVVTRKNKLNELSEKERKVDFKNMQEHAYATTTQEALSRLNLTYTDNYYGVDNQPLPVKKGYGFYPSFVSTTVWKAILGERHSYAKNPDFIDGWGHLLNATYWNNRYYYGVAVGQQVAEDPQTPTKDRFAFTTLDMFFKKR
ncbi:hypothetical protein ACJA23_01595 [Mycoplasma corogypsi]|uniref:hypothetical protein n=1 Tax=Mycoplasma corogypsi TaxID=2106 RepID=UPI003873CB43